MLSLLWKAHAHASYQAADKCESSFIALPQPKEMAMKLDNAVDFLFQLGTIDDAWLQKLIRPWTGDASGMLKVMMEITAAACSPSLLVSLPIGFCALAGIPGMLGDA